MNIKVNIWAIFAWGFLTNNLFNKFEEQINSGWSPRGIFYLVGSIICFLAAYASYSQIMRKLKSN